MGLNSISFGANDTIATPDGTNVQQPMGLPFDKKLLGQLKHLLPGSNY